MRRRIYERCAETAACIPGCNPHAPRPRLPPISSLALALALPCAPTPDLRPSPSPLVPALALALALQLASRLPSFGRTSPRGYHGRTGGHCPGVEQGSLADCVAGDGSDCDQLPG